MAGNAALATPLEGNFSRILHEYENNPASGEGHIAELKQIIAHEGTSASTKENAEKLLQLIEGGPDPC